MTVHICYPHGVDARRVMHCPNCNQRRRFVGLIEEWYDTIWTCCGCGDSYSVEGRMERPFARGWRERSKARARSRWATARPLREAIAAVFAERES